MNEKQKIIKAALQYAQSLIGTNYSRSARYRIFKGGSFDCSSYMLGIFSFAGFPLLNSKGSELLTSTYQVSATGFDLLYPTRRADIGKNLPSPSSLNTSYGAQPGDMIFYCNDSSTTRANKITHVAMVFDKNNIIHNGNNNEKCCKKPITYGARRICAIIRLRNDVKRLIRPTVQQGHSNRAFARMLQLSLNMHSLQPKLLVDGKIGAKSIAALNAFKASVGLPANGTCDAETWEVLNPYEGGNTIIGDEIMIKSGDKGENVKALQMALKKLGFDLGTFGPGKDGIDGDFGSVTQRAVESFQTANKLPKTGAVDTDTAAALLEALVNTACDTKALEAALAAANKKITAAQKALA